MIRSSVSAQLLACSVAMQRCPVPASARVADFADQDNVGSGTHGAAQRAVIRLGVEPDLALVDDRLLVRVQELDRVLDREDMVRRIFVAVVDQRRQRRRLAGTCRAHHQDKTALEHHEIAQHVRQPERLQLRHVRGDVTEHDRRIAALEEDVDTEPAEPGFRDRKVDLQLFLEVLDLLRRHEPVGRLLDDFRGQDLLVDREDLAFTLDLDRRVGGEEEIRRLLLHHQLEQRLGVEAGRTRIAGCSLRRCAGWFRGHGPGAHRRSSGGWHPRRQRHRAACFRA